MRQTKLKRPRMIIISSGNVISERSVNTGRNTAGICCSDANFSRAICQFWGKNVCSRDKILSPALNSCVMKQEKMTSVFNVVSCALFFQCPSAFTSVRTVPVTCVLRVNTKALVPLHVPTKCPLVYADLKRWRG